MIQGRQARANVSNGHKRQKLVRRVLIMRYQSELRLVESRHNELEINLILGQVVRQLRRARIDAKDATELHVLRNNRSNTLHVITDFEKRHLSRTNNEKSQRGADYRPYTAGNDNNLVAL